VQTFLDLITNIVLHLLYVFFPHRCWWRQRSGLRHRNRWIHIDDCESSWIPAAAAQIACATERGSGALYAGECVL